MLGTHKKVTDNRQPTGTLGVYDSQNQLPSLRNPPMRFRLSDLDPHQEVLSFLGMGR